MEAGKVKRLSGLDGAGVVPKGFQLTRLLPEQTAGGTDWTFRVT